MCGLLDLTWRDIGSELESQATMSGFYLCPETANYHYNTVEYFYCEGVKAYYGGVILPLLAMHSYLNNNALNYHS